MIQSDTYSNNSVPTKKMLTKILCPQGIIMSKSSPVTVMCTYRPVEGKEEQLFELVVKHWPVLKEAGLVTDEPAVVYRATDKQTGALFFVEIFSWKDARASEIAHRTPEVLAIWEPMEEILEGGPSPQLAVIERVEL